MHRSTQRHAMAAVVERARARAVVAPAAYGLMGGAAWSISTCTVDSFDRKRQPRLPVISP